jgi:IclR family acetate operon transcriptional repressor
MVDPKKASHSRKSAVKPAGRLAPAGRRASPARDQSVIQSLTRGLEILDAVIDARQPLRQQDVVQRFGIDKASAYRFLTTLERFGMLVKEPTTKTYQPGGRLVAWYAAMPPDRRLVDLAVPELKALVAEVEQSGHLAVFLNDRVLLVEYVAPESIVMVRNRVGGFEPLHCTAVGKAVLAFLPDRQQEELVESIELKPFTSRTIVVRDELRRELARTRRDGVAVDVAEYNDLIVCVAAPVFDARGRPVASLGVSTFKLLLDQDPDRIETVKAAVKASAAKVSRLIRSDGRPVQIGTAQ